jgi:putative flippase GtrA
MTGPDKPPMTADAVRFLVAGSVNTLLSLLVYQALLFVLSPAWSYAVAWAAGIIFPAVVYPHRVFPGGRRAMTDRLLLAMCYAGIFLAGLVLLQLFIALTAAPRVAIIGTLAVTTAISFLISRLILRRGK